MAAISVSIWPRKSSASAGSTDPCRTPCEQGLGVAGREVGRRRRGMAVIGRGSPCGDERLAPSPERGEVARPGGGVLAGQVGEAIEVGAEVRAIRIDDVVGPERGHYPAGPAAVPQPGVGRQLVRRGVGRGQELDPEPLVERPGAERILGEPGDEVVVDGVGTVGLQRLLDPEDLRRACGPATASRACPGTGGCARRTSARCAARRTSAGDPSSGATPSASRETPWL